MTAPFQAAWMLLKDMSNNTQHHREMMDALKRDGDLYGDTSNREHPLQGEEGYEENTRGGRGHALDLHEMDETPSDYHSQPKTLDEHRLNQGNPTAVEGLMDERQNMVDEQGGHLRQFNYFNEGDMPVQTHQEASDRYNHGQEAQEARSRLLDRMYENEIGQDEAGGRIHEQIQQDEQREGQQPEADEMDAMGVEPMGRQLGGKPPANIGQAGSLSDANPEKHSINPFAMDDAMNTFRPPQALHDWAAGNNQQPREERPKISDEQVESDIDAHYEGQPLQDEGANPPTSGRTMSASPRQEKRGHEGAGRAHDRPGFRSGEHMPL